MKKYLIFLFMILFQLFDAFSKDIPFFECPVTKYCEFHKRTEQDTIKIIYTNCNDNCESGFFMVFAEDDKYGEEMLFEVALSDYDLQNFKTAFKILLSDTYLNELTEEKSVKKIYEAEIITYLYKYTKLPEISNVMVTLSPFAAISFYICKESKISINVSDAKSTLFINKKDISSDINYLFSKEYISEFKNTYKTFEIEFTDKDHPYKMSLYRTAVNDGMYIIDLQTMWNKDDFALWIFDKSNQNSLIKIEFDISTLRKYLEKFNEWSNIARENNVKINKSIGRLYSLTYYFKTISSYDPVFNNMEIECYADSISPKEHIFKMKFEVKKSQKNGQEMILSLDEDDVYNILYNTSPGIINRAINNKKIKERLEIEKYKKENELRDKLFK